MTKINKIRKIERILIVMVMLFAIMSPIITKSNVQGGRSEIYKIERTTVDIDLSSEIPIFGYRLNPKNDIPIERDEEGVLKIQQNAKGTVDIYVSTKFREFLYAEIKVEKENLVSSVIESRYEIESPDKGFFMEFRIMTDYLRINLAFYQYDYQYSYDGVVERKLLKNLDFNDIDQDLNTESAKLVQNFRAELRNNQIEHVIISKRESTEQEVIAELGGPPTPTIDTYGIVHESFDYEGAEISEDIWDDYWEPDTSIEYGIYRYMPSESQMKSDLQVYNLDFFRLSPFYWHIQNILAYHLDSHGGPEWGVFEWQGEYQVLIGIIYPSEIEELWSSYYAGGGYVSIWPNEMLIMPAVSYGYYRPPSTNPTMAKAFVDNGANAFVGTTFSPPADMDDPLDIFWSSLCEENEDIETATEDMCDDSGWTYGTDWIIYGDTQSTLPD